MVCSSPLNQSTRFSLYYLLTTWEAPGATDGHFNQRKKIRAQWGFSFGASTPAQSEPWPHWNYLDGVPHPQEITVTAFLCHHI
jgi:hypothetical protein